MAGFYDYTARTLDGREQPLSAWQGQVVLVVNTASRCGFTPQYQGLEALWRRHKQEGFAVLGFPCNQFGAQEPGDEAAIGQFCTAKYDVTFPMFAKVEVNGPGAHPLFAFLRRAKRGVLGTDAVKWNFTKFLVDRQGTPLARFASATKPDALDAAVSDALAKPA